MTEATYHPLSADLTSNVSLQEYFLQGSILDSAADKLHERLQGLCDNVKAEMFTDRERTYTLNNSSTGAPIMVKASKSLLHPASPWQMKYIGSTEVGDRTKTTLLRSNVTVAVSHDPTRFLEDLGFSLRFEVVLKGKFYRKGRMKITVAKLTLQNTHFDASKLESASTSHLVEISALSSTGDNATGDEVRNFAQLLTPIVVLEKLDHRRLQLST